MMLCDVVTLLSHWLGGHVHNTWYSYSLYYSVLVDILIYRQTPNLYLMQRDRYAIQI